jgi:hypothetical protein
VAPTGIWGFRIHTNESVDGAEEHSEQDEPRVPRVSVVHGGHPEEHENNRLGRRAKHLHCVLNGRVRFVGNVRLDVVFHGDPAERDPV